MRNDKKKQTIYLVLYKCIMYNLQLILMHNTLKQEVYLKWHIAQQQNAQRM